nr:hypothetical protein [Bacillus cereus]
MVTSLTYPTAGDANINFLSIIIQLIYIKSGCKKTLAYWSNKAMQNFLSWIPRNIPRTDGGAADDVCITMNPMGSRER